MNERTVTLYRISQRRTDDSKVRRQIEEIVQRGLAGVRAKHFRVLKWTTPQPQSSPSGWVYRITLQFTPTGYGSAHYAKTWESVVRFIEVAAKSRGGWNEEIEKVPDAPFLWLLSALDGRTEIRKTTIRGTIHRKVPFVCVATVNDLELFESRHDGAMASRFSHKIYCPRPNAATLRKILMREIESMDGDPNWVEPALRYCIDVENNTDPRRVIAVCLTGRDDLLTGKFQDNLKACMPKGGD
jgi:hypothetical protein